MALIARTTQLKKQQLTAQTTRLRISYPQGSHLKTSMVKREENQQIRSTPTKINLKSNSRNVTDHQVSTRLK